MLLRTPEKWEVNPERIASKFDATVLWRLSEKAWGEAAFMFR